MEYSRRPTKSIPKENQLKTLNKIYQTYLVSTTMYLSPASWQAIIIFIGCSRNQTPISCMQWLPILTIPDKRFMGPTWGPSGADRTQVGPMLAPWTLLYGMLLQPGHGDVIRLKKYGMYPVIHARIADKHVSKWWCFILWLINSSTSGKMAAISQTIFAYAFFVMGEGVGVS